MQEFLIVIDALNQGFFQTFKLFAITLLGALPLGLIISFGSMSKFKPLSYFTKTVVWVIRGTPLMLQLFIIYYVPGQLSGGMSPWSAFEDDRFIASCVAFIINYA